MRNDLGVRATVICLGLSSVLSCGRHCRGASGTAERTGPVGSVAIVNETPIAKLDDIGGLGDFQRVNLIQAPDLARVGYITQRADKSVAVINGVESTPYDLIASLLFSPAGGRTCLVVRQGGNWCVVVDGKEGKWYPANVVSDVPMMFSRDGQRLAYVAHAENNPDAVIVDGVSRKELNAVNELVWSTDSARLLCKAFYWYVLEEGKPDKEFRTLECERAFSWR